MSKPLGTEMLPEGEAAQARAWIRCASPAEYHALKRRLLDAQAVASRKAMDAAELKRIESRFAAKKGT